MKTALGFSMAIALLCLGCSAIEAQDQQAEGRRFSGRLILLVADNFAKQSSEIHYKLLSDEDGRTFSLHFSTQEEIADVKSGTWVEIFGRQRNGRIDVKSLRPLDPTEKNHQNN